MCIRDSSLVAAISFALGLGLFVSERQREYMQSLESSPTRILRDSGSDFYAVYWHEITETRNETTIVDRLMLRRKIVVSHRRFALMDRSDKTTGPASAESRILITIFDSERETGYFVGTPREVAIEEIDIPQHAIIAR